MKKRADIITIAVFMAFIMVFAAIFIIQKDTAYSDQENRPLQQLPELNAEQLLNGTYSQRINTYFADQFPFRDFFVGIKGIAELSQLKNENNGVLIGEDGFLAVRSFKMYGSAGNAYGDYYVPGVVSANLNAVKRLYGNASGAGLNIAVMIPPRTIDVAVSKFDYPAQGTEQLQAVIKETLDGYGFIDTYALFKEKVESGEYVYYKTDHHYTSLGAYYAYAEVMKAFGMEGEIIPLADFETETATDSFYGTTWSKSGFKFIEPDKIEFMHYKYGDESEYARIKDGEGLEGFFDYSLLDTKDKYSAFIGGDSYNTSIYKKGAESRPKLLLAKDSFGLAIAPFLALHFDLEIVSVSTTRAITAAAQEKGCGYILLMYNTENIITAGDLISVQ